MNKLFLRVLHQFKTLGILINFNQTYLELVCTSGLLVRGRAELGWLWSYWWPLDFIVHTH